MVGVLTTKTLFAASLVGLMALASPSKAADWGRASARLQEDMTEAQVIAAVGYRPNKIEMTTCGGSLGRPWSCKTFSFRDNQGSLCIIFTHTGTTQWIVNSWKVD